MTPSASVRIALLQHACSPDKQANLDLAADLIRQAASRGATIVATQELFASRYFPQEEDEKHFDLAEPIPGPTTERLAALARELRIHLAASLFERRAPGIHHNTSVLIDPAGQIVGKYRKMHIPDDPRYFEKYYFTPGDLGFQVHHAGDLALGSLICWDQWFPEAARLTALRGAQLLLYPTAIGWIPEDPPEVQQRQRRAWQTVQHAHAITNGVFVAAVNRVGVEGDIRFWGSSFVVDPTGQVIAEASPDRDEILLADLDLSLIPHVRQQWPFLRDRRIDAYGDLTQRYLDPS
jgi:N-carbamoylputrescine amidase